MYEKELAAYFEAHKDEFLEDLAVLVAIPSVRKLGKLRWHRPN